MHSQLLAILRCPECLSRLTVADALEEAGQIASETLTCDGCSRDYPIIRSIRRFVPANNYASNFGFQWNEFRRTQLDSYTGVPISRERLFSSTEWSPEELKGKHVLDVGCGAGRFTEVMLEIGAHVVALDYSSAVEACFANFGAHPHLNVVQGDVYKLPFQRPAFDSYTAWACCSTHRT